MSDCELCASEGGEVLVRTEKFRIVLVDDAYYPGFCRVIWQNHVQEMTDLSASDRAILMEAVWAVETDVRKSMQPDKINLACLGNMTPHLHWHVIPRYRDDADFPHPIWRQAERTQLPAPQRKLLLDALRKSLAERIL